MKDQLSHWNNAHTNQWLHAHSAAQTAFAEETNVAIPSGATILELGCGEGNDSAYFAAKDHKITATDFSDVVIAQNKERWTDSNLQFAVQDTSKRLAFSDAEFDVVYARLSLHYFADETTQAIFKEINRVLKPGGLLCFMCKEVADPIYGKGKEIEPDMYELDGHVRHFFSKPYTEKLLASANFTAENIITGKEIIYDRTSAFIKVIAKKRIKVDIILPTISEIEALHKKYAPNDALFDLVFTHCQIIWKIADQLITKNSLQVDTELVKVGCLLHDIGVYPLFNYDGSTIDDFHYITHGTRGENILKNEGFSEIIWRIASHHTGVGLTKHDIQTQHLPLPVQDYTAETLEEKLVMYADKFHSKTNPPHFNAYESYKITVTEFGDNKVEQFEALAKQFGIPDLEPLAMEYASQIR